MKNSFTLILSIAVLFLTVIFTLQNAQSVQVKFIFWNANASLSLILLITFSMGVLGAFIALLPSIVRLRSFKSKAAKDDSDTL